MENTAIDDVNELAPIPEESIGTLRKYYIEHRKKQLLLEADRSDFTSHNPEKGRSNEKYFLQCLREFLPKRFGVGTGFVESFSGAQSKQQDIIIYDDLNNAPLFICDAWSIFPIEMVNANIEVKTNLTLKNLEETFSAEGTVLGEDPYGNKKSLRRMAEIDKKHYIGYLPSALAPRFYIFAYRSNIAESTLLTKLKEFSLKYNVHCHGLFILEKDIYVARKPLGDRTKYEHWVHRQQNLGFFLNNLLESLFNMGIQITDRGKYIKEIQEIRAEETLIEERSG